MSYSINSNFLSVPWFDKLVAETLDMYLRGEDISRSPLTETGRIAARKGKWHFTFFDLKTEEEREQNFRKREAALIELYHNIKRDGYNGSIIAVWFDRDGQIHLYDGFHRLAVMKYLGIEANVNCETIWLCKDFDFPLRNVLVGLPRLGKCTYLPVKDPRVSDFPVDRSDSPHRLEYILRNAVGDTFLDIGCSEGYFSLELAKKGYRVSATDSDRGKAAVTRYLSILNNMDIDVRWGIGEDLAEESAEPYDNILYMSVFHDCVLEHGTALAFHRLRKLRGKAKRLFFEVPQAPEEWQWKNVGGPPLYNFKDEFRKEIEDALDMDIIDTYHGFRPIYLLASRKISTRPNFRRISDREWRDHQRWEAHWWGNCANTFGEQLLQQNYAGLMGLDKLAGPKYSFDLQGKSVLDIGGGPVSLLLRCENPGRRRVVVDPCHFPQWVSERYRAAGIELLSMPAEEMNFDKEFDEAWIYNCLQHVRDPAKVIAAARKAAKVIRIYEPLEVGVHPGHPHNLAKDALDEAFGRKGLIRDYGGKPGELYYHGVFSCQPLPAKAGRLSLPNPTGDE